MLSRILVILQFLLAAALTLSARPAASSAGWLVLAGCGALLSVWAMVSIGWRRVSVMPQADERTQLVTRGPYRWVRHPMYSGLLLFCFGLVLIPWRWWKLVAFVLLTLVLAKKSQIEEQYLLEQFPAYAEYVRRTKRLVPFVW